MSKISNLRHYCENITGELILSDDFDPKGYFNDTFLTVKSHIIPQFSNTFQDLKNSNSTDNLETNSKNSSSGEIPLLNTVVTTWNLKEIIFSSKKEFQKWTTQFIETASSCIKNDQVKQRFQINAQYSISCLVIPRFKNCRFYTSSSLFNQNLFFPVVLSFYQREGDLFPHFYYFKDILIDVE